jgi:lipid A oxidase
LGYRDGSLLGRLQPYAGIGAGISIPSIEVFSALTDEYQLVGPNVQGFLGSHLDLWGPLALFAEYKFNWADIDADLGNGGRLKTQIWTHQLLFGASLWLAWGDPPSR